MHQSIVNIKDTFNKRMLEIEKYLHLLEIFDLSKNAIEDIDITYYEIERTGKNKKNKIISNEISWTMNGAAILMLYNLIEWTMRELINAIYKEIEIHLSTKDINSLSVKIKKEIKSRFSKMITENNVQELIDNGLEIGVFKIIGEINNGVTSYYNFSGNVDVQKIKEVSNKLGFSANIKKQIDISSIMQVKIHRNSLAHGNKSFEELAKLENYDYNKLNSSKEEY